MNNDLISREALREALNEMFDTVEVMLFDDIIATIDNAPTVTPDKIQAIMSDYLIYRCEPQRPQGEWEWVQYDANPNIGNWHCSECHYIPQGKKEYQKTNFCPNCGAKMKGGAE